MQSKITILLQNTNSYDHLKSNTPWRMRFEVSNEWQILQLCSSNEMQNDAPRPKTRILKLWNDNFCSYLWMKSIRTQRTNDIVIRRCEQNMNIKLKQHSKMTSQQVSVLEDISERKEERSTPNGILRQLSSRTPSSPFSFVTDILMSSFPYHANTSRSRLVPPDWTRSLTSWMPSRWFS